jgi:hypothetical protein
MLFTTEARRHRENIKSIFYRKKREERRQHLYFVFKILRIFAFFAAEKYFFFASPRLCG